MRKRKVFGWILFVVGIILIRGFIIALGLSSSLPGDINYFIVAFWIAVILVPFYGWYRLVLRRG